jgi:hypothetical protein
MTDVNTIDGTSSCGQTSLTWCSNNGVNNACRYNHAGSYSNYFKGACDKNSYGATGSLISDLSNAIGEYYAYAKSANTSDTSVQGNLKKYGIYIDSLGRIMTNSISLGINANGLSDDAVQFIDHRRKLDASYQNLREHRNKLDFQMSELLNSSNSVNGEQIMQSNAAIYTTLLWTVMASSLIYYVFLKL